MMGSYAKGCRTLWEKEKLLVKRYVLQTHKNKSLFGKGLTNNKTLAWSKLQVFADDKSYVVKRMFSVVFDKVENILEIVLEKKNHRVTNIFLIVPIVLLTLKHKLHHLISHLIFLFKSMHPFYFQLIPAIFKVLMPF